MFWKMLHLQNWLNALFDDGWCSLGLPEVSACADACLHDGYAAE